MKQNTGLFSKHVLGQITAIFFVQASSASAFAVFYSGLSIYLTKNRYFSQETASVITGLFLSLNYLLPLIGGIVANRLISYKNLYLIGMIISFFGCISLLFNNLYIGLSLFLMGSLSNVCLSIFLTQLFSIDQKEQRRVAFIWNYIGMNIGFMGGYLFTGFSTFFNNYFYLFFAMSLLVLISLILAIFFIKEPKMNVTINKSITHQITTMLPIIVMLVSIINFAFHYASNLHCIVTALTIILFSLIMLYALRNTKGIEKINLIKFIYFSIASIIFWSFYMLTPIAIMQLIETSVQKKLFNINFAPQWFTNVNSFVILIFAPVLTVIAKNKKIFSDTSHYFTVGFLFACFAFVTMASGLYFSSETSKLSPLIILGYLISLTIGEIFISPISDTFIGEYIQESLRGLMTGAERVAICIGVLFATSISNTFIFPYINKSGLTLENSIKLTHLFFPVSCLFFILAFAVIPIMRNKQLYLVKKQPQEFACAD